MRLPSLAFVTRPALLAAMLFGAGSAAADRPMRLLSGGVFGMGPQASLPVELDAFAIDVYPVRNRDFQRFVEATGYVTEAEEPLDPRDFPGLAPETLVPGSAVFMAAAGEGARWTWVDGAHWRMPEGAGSNLAGRDEHPVVHVSFRDAERYCEWEGKSLPTEAQFEYAARGGLAATAFAWGDEAKHRSERLANLWEGTFPVRDAGTDGYTGTSPVGEFPPNGFGLYDMAGNVWEWTSDWFGPMAATSRLLRNPAGVSRADSSDPMEPGVPKKVIKGGSYLCSENYCQGYRPGARMAADPHASAGHTGFRCARNK